MQVVPLTLKLISLHLDMIIEGLQGISKLVFDILRDDLYVLKDVPLLPIHSF